MSASNIVFVITGHVREELEHDNLFNLLQFFCYRLHKTSDNVQVSVVLDSWNESYPKRSWRSIDRSKNKHITVTDIMKYFQCQQIKRKLSQLPFQILSVVVRDDDYLQLNGNTDSTAVISHTPCPVICWKRMWYSKHNAMKFVCQTFHTVNTIVINTRFDICHYFSKEHIVFQFFEFLRIRKVVENKDDLYFLKLVYDLKEGITNQRLLWNCDNILFSSANTMIKVTSHFHNNLDNILNLPLYNNKIMHQENFVFYEALDKNWVLSLKPPKWTFISVTKTSSTSFVNYFNNHYKKYFHCSNCHDNYCTNDNNSIIIVRDIKQRFFSMYKYWKYGADDTLYFPNEKNKEKLQHINVLDFISILQTNKEELLYHSGYLWNQHFANTTDWIKDTKYENIIVIKFEPEKMNEKMQCLLTTLNIPTDNILLSKVNVSHNTPEIEKEFKKYSIQLDIFLKSYFKKDFELLHDIEKNPESFKLVI